MDRARIVPNLAPLLVVIGLVASTPSLGEVHEHDPHGRLVRTVYDDGTELRFEWDANGNLLRRQVIRSALDSGPPETPGGENPGDDDDVPGSPPSGCGCEGASGMSGAPLFPALAALFLALSSRKRRGVRWSSRR